jgi:Zn-dependent M28 family amino/carboxypeptidase
MRLWVGGLAVVLLGFGAEMRAQGVPASVRAAENSIDAEKIRAHVRFLADDLLEGRGPGLRGSEIAAKYIATEFALDGLKPGGDNGTYMQQVKFVGMNAIAAKTSFAVMRATGGPGHSMELTYGEDYTVSNRTLTPVVDVNAPIVFVGYGVRAPEFGWDDYAGVDVKGKVVLCIVGDPPSDDPKFFGGRALTYYGRWTYKFEEAARQGAVGALIIHRTDLASYGWDVVKNSNTSEKTYLAEDKNPQLEAASWVQLEVARKIFAAGGMELDREMMAAGKKGFKAVELPVRLKAHVESTVRPFESANVIGILPGAQVGKQQAVLYTAHYDHLGFVPGMKGDNVYNGAADNGTGCGVLLEEARAWAGLAAKPLHAVIFAAVTAEEQGLLGSEYLGQHPPVPAGQIALDINYDMIPPVGVPEEINVNGAQRTSFYPVVRAIAKRFGLTIVPDARPEAGSYYRSDHFSLSRVGIPAFSVDTGSKYEGHDRAWGEAQEKDYNDHRYHNFSDNYTPDMDFRGNAKLARFGMELGWEALTAPATVRWNAGDEFEGARKGSLGSE